MVYWEEVGDGQYDDIPEEELKKTETKKKPNSTELAVTYRKF